MGVLSFIPDKVNIRVQYTSDFRNIFPTIYFSFKQLTEVNYG
jgi:hypothetical protein